MKKSANKLFGIGAPIAMHAASRSSICNNLTIPMPFAIITIGVVICFFAYLIIVLYKK
jgi:hypothetical protein